MASLQVNKDKLNYLLSLPIIAKKKHETSMVDFITQNVSWNDFVEITNVIDIHSIPDITTDVYGKNIAFKGNNNIIRPDAILPYTNLHHLARIRCKNDIFYFSRFFHIVTLDDGKIPIELRPYQVESLQNFISYPYCILNSSRQIGKCFLFNTYINIINKSNGKEERITIGNLYLRLIIKCLYKRLKNGIKKVCYMWKRKRV